MQVNFNVLNQEGVPALFESDIRPQPGYLGRLYFSTNYDNPLAPKGIWADDGHDWQQIATNGGGGTPTLQQVTEAGNSTNQKIELVNWDSTVDALAILLQANGTVGINIYSHEEQNVGIVINNNNALFEGINLYNNGTDFKGLTILNNNLLTDDICILIQQDSGTCIDIITSNGNGLMSIAANGDAIVGMSANGIGGYFSTDNGYGVYSFSTQGVASGFFQNIDGVALQCFSNNSYPLLISQTTGNLIESIKFTGITTYTGAAVAAAEYLPINIDGTTHLIRLFSPV
jgi:hypothetical protein